MLNRFMILSVVLMMLFTFTGGVYADMPTIAKYQGGRTGAFSFTFDDGWRHQVENTCEILEPLDLRGTFFIIPLYLENPKKSRDVLTWQRAKKLIADGHEVGTHGSVGEKLHEVDGQRLDYLINESWRLIKDNTGTTPVSYALPGGSRATDKVVEVIEQHHYFIRNSKLLPDVKTQSWGNVGKRVWDDQKTRQKILEHTQNGGWYIAIIHAIVSGYSPFKSKDEFRTHCEWLKSQEDKIWIAPMGEIGRYVRAREAATLKVIEQTDHSIRFTLSCEEGTPEVIRDTKLTVVIPAAGAIATSTPGAVVKDGKVLVDVKPEGKEVTVEWTTGG